MHLNLSFKNLGPNDAANLKLPESLTSLYIYGNVLGPEGAANLRLPEGLTSLDGIGPEEEKLKRWVRANEKAVKLTLSVKLGSAGIDEKSGKFEAVPNEVVCSIIISSKLETVLLLSRVCRRFRDCALSNFVTVNKVNGQRMHSLFRQIILL